MWDEERNGMWVHGGYTTFYPYISSDGAGSAFGNTVREAPSLHSNRRAKIRSVCKLARDARGGTASIRAG